jgi:hypothetical protein
MQEKMTFPFDRGNEVRGEKRTTHPVFYFLILALSVGFIVLLVSLHTVLSREVKVVIQGYAIVPVGRTLGEIEYWKLWTSTLREKSMRWHVNLRVKPLTNYTPSQIVPLLQLECEQLLSRTLILVLPFGTPSLALDNTLRFCTSKQHRVIISHELGYSPHNLTYSYVGGHPYYDGRACAYEAMCSMSPNVCERKINGISALTHPGFVSDVFPVLACETCNGEDDNDSSENARAMGVRDGLIGYGVTVAAMQTKLSKFDSLLSLQKTIIFTLTPNDWINWRDEPYNLVQCAPTPYSDSIQSEIRRESLDARREAEHVIRRVAM